MQKKKGISLIVLVITIIVMIILAAAVVISLNNNGIIDKSNTAVKNTNLKSVEEMANVYWGEAYMSGNRTPESLKSYISIAFENAGVNTSGYIINVTSKGVLVGVKGNWAYKKDSNNKYTLVTNGKQDLGIGDTINYVPTGTNYAGNWCILGANENGELMLMARENVKTVELGSKTDYSKARYDWVNTKKILDDECEIFGNGTGASRVTKARSIRIEDVNNLLNDVLKTEKKQVEQKPQKVEEKLVKQENIIQNDNPFFGDKNSLAKLKKQPDYEIVEEEETIERTIIHKKIINVIL